MTVDAGTDYYQIMNIAMGIYQNAVNKLIGKDLIPVDGEKFSWRIGKAIHSEATKALVMPEDYDEKTEVPYLFGCKVEWVYENPWELSLWYDMTEI